MTGELAEQVMQRGYCTMPALFDSSECREISDAIEAWWIAQGRPSLAGWGGTIHPLVEKVPRVKRFVTPPEPLAVMRAVFGAEPTVRHTGARLADETSAEQIAWHEHYGWDAARLAGRKTCERLLMNIYVHGCDDDYGPFVVYPRRFNEPMQPMAGRPDGHWPGEHTIKLPPGSVVIFDTAVWHTALRGNKPGMRKNMGGHYQSINDRRAHPEDNYRQNA